MINIEYTNSIKIVTGNLNGIFKEDQLPLKIQIKKAVSKDIVWETNLISNMWATFPESEINDVVIKDAKGNFISQYYWDVMNHGSIFYKSLWLYCKGLVNQGKKPKGLVIGTHDGEFGEWVPLVRNFLSDMILVEASEKQFSRLKSNYEGKQGVQLLNELITTNGDDVEFFEGGAGYTNSIVERVIRSWEKEEIHSTKRKSTSINDLIERCGGNFDWFHFDVEGLDGKLIMSTKKEHLPNLVIFEDYNLIQEEKENLYSYFRNLNYNIHSDAGICLASK